MTEQVSIIIVNLNGEQYLERCLSTVLDQTCSHFQVALVDNGSTDGSLPLVRERFPSVRIVDNRRSLGLSPAINIDIRATDSPFVVTLNNDTWVEPDWLEVMEQDPRVGK